jgi:hypothetical protein
VASKKLVNRERGFPSKVDMGTSSPRPIRLMRE